MGLPRPAAGTPYPGPLALPRKPHGAEARLEVVVAVCYFKHLIIVSSFQFVSSRRTLPFVFSQSWGCHTSSFVPGKPALDRRGKVKASKEHSLDGDMGTDPSSESRDPRSERKSEEGADRRR